MSTRRRSLALIASPWARCRDATSDLSELHINLISVRHLEHLGCCLVVDPGVVVETEVNSVRPSRRDWQGKSRLYRPLPVKGETEGLWGDALLIGDLLEGDAQ